MLTLHSFSFLLTSDELAQFATMDDAAFYTAVVHHPSDGLRTRATGFLQTRFKILTIQPPAALVGYLRFPFVFVCSPFCFSKKKKN